MILSHTPIYLIKERVCGWVEFRWLPVVRKYAWVWCLLWQFEIIVNQMQVKKKGKNNQAPKPNNLWVRKIQSNDESRDYWFFLCGLVFATAINDKTTATNKKEWRRAMWIMPMITTTMMMTMMSLIINCSKSGALV